MHATFEQQSLSTDIQHPGFLNLISPIDTNTAEKYPQQPSLRYKIVVKLAKMY